MSDRDIFIADGHHRYETALAFKKEMEDKGLCKTGEEPFNYVLMFLSNMEDEGLSLLPTHRIIEVDSKIKVREILKQHFDLQKISSDDMSGEQAITKMLETIKSTPHSFGMYLTNTGNYYTLRFNGESLDVDLPDCLKKLDVSILHKFIFEHLLKVDHYEYEMDPDVAVKRAMQGSFEAVFFNYPIDIIIIYFFYGYFFYGVTNLPNCVFEQLFVPDVGNFLIQPAFHKFAPGKSWRPLLGEFILNKSRQIMFHVTKIIKWQFFSHPIN